MVFPSLSDAFLAPAFALYINISWLKNLRWVDGPIPQLGAMSIYESWSLQVLSPRCWVSWLISSTLGPGSFFDPWDLGHSTSHSIAHPCHIFLFIFKALWTSHQSLLMTIPPMPSSPHNLPHPGPSLPLPPMIIFFPFLNGIEASTL